MSQNPEKTVATYFSSWKAHDFDTFQSILADDVTFAGPMDQVDSAVACRKAIEGLSKIMTDIVIHKVLVDGADVLTWYDMHSSVAEPTPVANWCHVEDGKISKIQVTFDPCGLAPQSA